MAKGNSKVDQRYNQKSEFSSSRAREWCLRAWMFKKAKIQSDRSLDKLKLRILVRGDLQNKELVRDTWSPTDSMWSLK